MGRERVTGQGPAPQWRTGWIAIGIAVAWMVATNAAAADRAIGVDAVFANHWSWLTPTTATSQNGLGRHMMAGFWQRSSGAAPGVGSNNVAIVEFQLPETPGTRVKSATFQMSGRASQCAGAEAVVFDVYAYAGNGKPEIGDAGAGVRVAQLTGDCKDNPAFNQPIDVTTLVRQLSVPAGVRHIGFNVRKANNRRPAAYFGFGAAKLTVVIADQDVAVVAPGSATGAGGAGADGSAGGTAQQGDVVAGLLGAAGTLLRGKGEKPSRDQAREEASKALQGQGPPAAGSGTPQGAEAPAGSPAAAPAAGATTGAGASSSATAPAPAAPTVVATAPAITGSSATASKISADIVGLRLGMSIADVKRALQTHSTAMNVDEQIGIVNNVAATKYLSWVIARNPRGAPAGSSDAIGVHFPPPPNQHRAVFIERFTGFQSNELPLYDTIRAALIKKFGQPSFSQEGMLLWTYDANGTQIVDANVPGRCAKFPPTDPPARGQNVIFNGYKTAGCGVTIYARFDRGGTRPGDRELVRFLSVSMVDDSQFEAMRQAAAQYATQAQRESAGKVAAPKL